jgi:hypothetical protein
MVCSTVELEAAADVSVSIQDLRNSLLKVDQWGTPHTYLPYLFALFSGDPFVGITVAYLYESMAVLQHVGYDRFIPVLTLGGAQYTGPMDGLIQDPGYGIAGALAAFIITRAFRLYGGVGSWRAAVGQAWGAWGYRPPTTPWFVLLSLGAIAACNGLSWRPRIYYWGSSNHLVAPAWLLIALALWFRGGSPAYAVLALAGPCLVSNVASGIAYSGEGGYLGSTFLWSNATVIVYALTVYLWLRGRPRYLPLSPF